MVAYKTELNWLGNAPIPVQGTINANMTFSTHIPTGVTPYIQVQYLSILHQHLGDLEVRLTNPGGTTVELFTRVGSDSDGILNFSFYDGAATDMGASNLPQGVIARNGNFNPEGAAVLAALTTTNMTGTWNLSITDAAPGDSGQLLSWGLFISFQYDGVVNGTSAAQTLYGSDVIDRISGFAGNDRMFGFTGNDVLIGGLGRDTMWGGSGRDIFDFNAIGESKVGALRDTIMDFQRGQDDIDLRTIDAQTGPGNQRFDFIGRAAFSGEKGQLRFIDKGAICLVQGDVNGNGKADFEIVVHVGTLGAGDFLV